VVKEVKEVASGEWRARGTPGFALRAGYRVFGEEEMDRHARGPGGLA